MKFEKYKPGSKYAKNAPDYRPSPPPPPMTEDEIKEQIRKGQERAKEHYKHIHLKKINELIDEENHFDCASIDELIKKLNELKEKRCVQ